LVAGGKDRVGIYEVTVISRDEDMSANALVKAGHPLPRLFRSALNWLTGSSGRAFVLIFILACGIRAYSLKNIRPWDLIPSPDRELGAIVRSLVETGQFANPYILETGPTAHLPPIPPAMFALVYYLFGYHSITGYIDIGLIIMTNSLIYALMPWIADGLGTGRQAGFIGGLLGAFIVEFEWGYHGEGLTAVLLGLMLMVFLRRWNDGQHPFRDAALLGLGVGISFHVQPALLLVFLGCLAFELGWHRTKSKAAIIGMLVLGVVLACAPWAWRNYVVFHEFFFIRSNLGLELRMGNHDGAAATMDETIAQMIRQGAILHPRGSLNEAKILRDIGEMAYMDQALSETLAWVWKNPLEFYKLTFLRFIHYWFGPLALSFTSILVAALTILAILGARRILPNLPRPQRILVLTPLITYPLIYYLVPYMARYRMPIDWILFLLASVEIWDWIGLGKVRADNPPLEEQ